MHVMEEFKKPTLPIATNKDEKPGITLDKPGESTDKSDSGETVKHSSTQLCPYKVPHWSKQPSDGNKYSFEVLKSGQIIEEIKDLEKKAYWTFGRLPENDIEMAHPTISRFHAICQYRPKKEKDDSEDKCPPEGWYIYDLGSTHGTFLNKQRIPPKVYIRIRVGHILRLGGSTRAYILQGPTEDEEPESELSVTEIRAKRQQYIEQAALTKKRLVEEAIERASNEGCSWGMTEDADEETDMTHNPYAITNNEELFLDDPKKTLRGYFEREGLELIYKCDEMSAGSFVCRVELPLDDTNGRPIIAEVVHKGKKKDCVVQCALEACRILDRHGVLRQANQEPLKRKQKSQESDSDDDDFWDRTGDVARKKQRKANLNSSVTMTYEDLLKQETDLDKQIKEIENRIADYQERQKLLKTQTSDDGEDLDAFMENLQGRDIKLDKTEIRKLRLEDQRLKSDKQRVQRLIKIAKPLDLPFRNQIQIENAQSQINSTQTNTKKQQLPLIGKRNQFSKFKIVKLESNAENKEAKPIKFLNSDEEEVEEDEKDNTDTEHNFKENTSKQDDKENPSNTKDKIKENPGSAQSNTAADTYNNSNVCKNLGTTNNEKSELIDYTTLENQQNLNALENASSSNKKKRKRIRQRGKRQEVDMDDDADYEASDRYAKWIPPENQTGDGMTELNKKFGY